MAVLLGSVQGRGRTGESKHQLGGRFPPCLLERLPAASQLFSFLSPPCPSICPSSPAEPPSPRGLVRTGLLQGEAVGVRQLPSPSMANTKANHAYHCHPSWAAGGFCGITHRGNAGLGRQAGPWTGKGRCCEQASLTSCLGRGWLCPGTVWPGGAEGFPQLASMLPGLAGNMSPLCPGSDQLIPTNSSWHCCYNSRTHFSVFSRPIPSCCPKVTPREQLK